MRRRGIGLAVAAAVAAACGQPPAPAHVCPTSVERSASNIVMPLLLRDGDTLTLSTHCGQPIIVSFFASWCAPCRFEMPALEVAWNEHREDSLLVVAVGVQDGRRPLTSFAASLGVTFPVVWDDMGEASGAYGVSRLPTTVFIGRDGMIRRTWLGALAPADLDREVAALMAR